MMTQPKNKNFKVFQASAGAGKTFTIVKEYLKLCLGNAKSVDNFRHILAITFTNASANDMKKKILDHLNDIIDSVAVRPKTMEAQLIDELNISDADLKRHALMLRTRILHDYSSFCVSTIDSFVQKLSRTFAHDLDLPSQYTVSIDDDDMAAAIVENLAMKISKSNPVLVQALTQFSKDKFAKEGVIMPQLELSKFVMKLMTERAFQKNEQNNINTLQQYNQTLDFLKDKVESFDKVLNTFLDDFKAVEKRYGLSLEDYSNGSGGFYSFVNKVKTGKLIEPSSRFAAVAADGSKWVSAKGKKRFSTAVIQQVGDELAPLFSKFIADYEAGVGSYLFYKPQRDLLYLYALRLQIRNEFEHLAQDEEVVHISEFNKLLNKVLGDFSVPFIYERIGEYFQHVFVDEFQDTSVLQWHNLLPLVDNGLSSNQMSMVVGDGKQSIYRFRSGEVEQIVQLPEIYALPANVPAFLQYQKNLVSNFVFTPLNTNYRSFANVVKFNNAFFEATVAKESSETLRKVYKDENKAVGKSVSIEQLNDRQEEGLVQVELYDDKETPNYSCERIEAIVRELLTKGYSLGDIAILVRASKTGSLIANYLNDKDIPIVSQDSILLKKSDKVQLLVNTLKYLVNENNAAVISNVLYYNQLVNNPAFSGDAGSLFDVAVPVAQRQVTLESALHLPANSFAEVRSKATCLYDLCASLTRIYGVDTLYDAYLNYFMEEVSAFQSGQEEGIMEFLSLWEQKQEKLAVKMKSSDAVQILTIHKSKGLEFNVVIYPDAITDLSEKRGKKSPEEWVRPDDMGFAPIPNLEKVILTLNSECAMMSTKTRQLYEKELESERLDNLNLLYVAFTRAKQRLYVIAKQGDVKKPNVLRDFLAQHESNLVGDAPMDALVYRFGDADFVNPSKPEPKAEKTLAIDSQSVDWMTRVEVDPSPSVFWSSEADKMQPNEWGGLVHKILSEIRTVEDVDEALRPYLLDGTIDQPMAAMLADKFLQMARHPLIAEAFGKGAMVKNECEILYGGKIKRPDRYAELPEVIYLLDYKTGKKTDEHTTQLDRYVAALKCMTDKEIRAFLVYLSEEGIEVVTT